MRVLESGWVFQTVSEGAMDANVRDPDHTELNGKVGTSNDSDRGEDHGERICMGSTPSYGHSMR